MLIELKKLHLQGIAEQLGPTSPMAWQSRTALDMLLANKRRGV